MKLLFALCRRKINKSFYAYTHMNIKAYSKQRFASSFRNVDLYLATKTIQTVYKYRLFERIPHLNPLIRVVQ